jgi:hypothetical protein
MIGHIFKDRIRQRPQFIEALNDACVWAVVLYDSTFELTKKTFDPTLTASVSQLSLCIEESLKNEAQLIERNAVFRRKMSDRIEELLALSAILSKMTQETLFCIFKHCGRQDLFRFAQVCKIWRSTIQKYQCMLPTASDEFVDLCTKLGVDGRNLPLGLRCNTRRNFLFYRLVTQQFAYDMLRELLQRRTTITFNNQHTSEMLLCHYQLINVHVKFVLTDSIPYDFKRIDLSGDAILKQMSLIKSFIIMIELDSKGTIGIIGPTPGDASKSSD